MVQTKWKQNNQHEASHSTISFFKVVFKIHRFKQIIRKNVNHNGAVFVV